MPKRLPNRRWLTLLGFGGCLALSGCGPSTGLPNVLYIAIATGNDQTFNADLRQEVQERLEETAQGFRQIYPQTSFQFSLYPEDQILAAMRRRSRAGLEPDLLYVNGDTALQLLRAGLVDPFPATKEQLSLFNPEELQRLRTDNGQLAGLPLLVQTQLSCFNRKRLDQAPTTLKELLSASANGQTVGLSVDLYQLIWSLGSTGALPAFERAAQGLAPSQEQSQALERWLSWLQEANNQQKVTFYSDQQTVETEFIAGRLDWIPCRSSLVPQLRRALGANNLGVAPLPDGDGPKASPVNRLRVLALGRHSSRQGRQRAVTFTAFGVNPLTQRSLTMGSQTVLPANRFVTVPVRSSQLLRTIVTAAEQGQQANSLVSLFHTNDPRIPQVRNLLTELVFGEIKPQLASTRLIKILRGRP
ncbi:MAG: ABC transporter substrate-binding protein [Cyanobium sp.]